jgi:hypothetical protein
MASGTYSAEVTRRAGRGLHVTVHWDGRERSSGSMKHLRGERAWNAVSRQGTCHAPDAAASSWVAQGVR